MWVSYVEFSRYVGKLTTEWIVKVNICEMILFLTPTFMHLNESADCMKKM